MRKLLSYSDYKRITRLPLNEFNRWVTSIYKSGVQDGVVEGEGEYDRCMSFDEESLKDFLLSIPGIGKNTADKIVEAMIKAYERHD